MKRPTRHKVGDFGESLLRLVLRTASYCDFSIRCKTSCIKLTNICTKLVVGAVKPLLEMGHLKLPLKKIQLNAWENVEKLLTAI